MKILHGLTVVHGHPTGKPTCISIPDQLHFRKKVKHSLLLFNSRMRLRSCVSPADCRSPTRAAAGPWAADKPCVSPADCRLLRPRCGRTLDCRQALCVSCRLPLTSSALRQGPGLPTSPVCLLQTVGEPSVLSARSLRTYVPLRAKPKRKRVCKRYTGLGEKALGTLPQPLLKHICKRHTDLGEKALGTLPQPPSGNTSARDIQGPHKEAPVTSPILTPFPASSSSISYRYEKQKEWDNYPWSAPGRCRSSLRCSLSCLRVPARPPAPRIRSYATLCG